LVAPIKSALDDGLLQLQVLDFSGGLNTNTGALSLGPSQSPDCKDVFAFQGRLQFRGGFSLYSLVTAAADRMFSFYDVTGTQHLMVWSSGNLYDCESGSPMLVASAVYTAGDVVAVCVLNEIMYWATPRVPLRQYDGTTEQAVANSGGTGTVAPPAAFYLTTYNGQIVAFRPVISSVTYASSFMWSNVNDPTTWVGLNIQLVGSNDGGQIMWGIPLGIPALVVGKSSGATQANLFVYSGALVPGSLTQTPISCPVGALDPFSAKAIPSKQGLSQIIFIASDGHFWVTNGVESWLASENILALTENYIRDALAVNPNQPFYSAYYTRWQYYVCSVGSNTHFVYRPGSETDPPAWWFFQGWPSGDFATFSSATNGGFPGLYTAGNGPGNLGVYQVAQDQVNDGGADISPYYITPYLHGGKAEREKQFQWFALMTYNVGVKYDIAGYSIPRSDGGIYIMDTLHFEDPGLSVGIGTTTLIWDVGEWDVDLWGGGLSTIAQPYQPCVNHAPIRVTTAGTIWVEAGEKAPLKSAAMQFKIAWAGGIPDFQILGYNVRYLERSFGFVGNAPYQTAGGIISTTDPYTTTGTN